MRPIMASEQREQWPSKALDDLLCDAQSGFASGERASDGVIQLRMNNVSTDGTLNLADTLRVPASKAQVAKYRLLPGDVLFNSTNSPELVGKTTIFHGYPEPVVFSNHFLRLRVDSGKLDPSYLARWFTHQWNQRVFQGLCTQWVNQAAVRKDDLLALRVPLPPFPEQQRIAAILARADRLRRLRRHALELSAGYLQAVFVEMFGDTSLFEQVTIESVASDQKYALSSGPFGSSLTSEDYVYKGVVVLRGLNVSTGCLDLTDVKYVCEEKAQFLRRSEVKPDDVVVVAVGSSGLAFRIPEHLHRAIMSQNFNKLTPDSGRIEPIFLEYCLNSQHVQKQFGQEITDTVRTFLSLTKLKEVVIILPSLEQQRHFVRVVHKVDRLRAQQREALRQAEQLFGALLDRAFRGEL